MFSNPEVLIALIVLCQLAITAISRLIETWWNRDKTEAETQTEIAKAGEKKVDSIDRLVDTTFRFADFVDTLIAQRNTQETRLADLTKKFADMERSLSEKGTRITQLEQESQSKDRRIEELEKAITEKDKRIEELEGKEQKNADALAAALDELRKLREADLEELQKVKDENARLKEELDSLKNAGEKALIVSTAGEAFNSG